ncbi:unnamed protein product [Paramecium primaurelia]|uniref:TLDc domain-containing protein n=1 Tax=Paramecium primaurelia TaxID=5886 RepID=A0A8S1JN81_PARPR|nr:unnamed protein product [Paramecium primaurelia]
MEKKFVKQNGIYCEDDQHFHRGQKIKYLMIKKDKGSITKRLFCDECYLGKYKSYQQYCCDIQELINGNIYEAFKYTKFDSETKQQYFNYIRNHNPYLNEQFINDMIDRLTEEVLSDIKDLKDKLLENISLYLNEIKKWVENEKIINYFECDDLKVKFLDENFQRSPLKFEALNSSAEEYVKKINDDKLTIDVETIIKEQQKFFNLDKFNLNYKEIIQQIKNMQEKTFSDYKFSQSILANPYIERIAQKISPETEETFIKSLNLIYRMTKHGSNYQTLQQIPNLDSQDTITIIQTKNKCIFGVYHCKSEPKKSILFQMNKEKYFLIKESKAAFQLNLNANLQTWLLNFGEGDIIINSTFTRCTSNLGTGFDISGFKIFDNQEYLSDCKLFDIYDMEIFAVQNKEKININQNPVRTTQINNPQINNPIFNNPQINNPQINNPFNNPQNNNPQINSPFLPTLQKK